MNVETETDRDQGRTTKPVKEKDFLQASPFLSGLMEEGSWREVGPDTGEAGEGSPLEPELPNLQDFRRDFRQIIDDPETALLSLRRLRIRTLLALGRADLAEQIRPHQVRARLRALSETLVQAAWWLAEHSLREKYVHPIILERRNINPPLAICSLSRLGTGDPWYTTGPAPLFVHSRAAQFAPALSEKDFSLARGSEKEWLPAREYFHRLARRVMSYLSVPDPAGKGFGHMAEDQVEDAPQLLPGALVILFGAFEEHFLGKRPVRERLALMRLRFLVGQDRLGKAVEAAARDTLLKTAFELGHRLRAGVNAWYRARSEAERLPLARGGLLDIERSLRLLQFCVAKDAPQLLEPSPLKGFEKLAAAGLISAESRKILAQSYGWQWFLVNRLSLFGQKNAIDWVALKKTRAEAERLDKVTGLAGAADRTIRNMKAAREIMADLIKERRQDCDLLG